MKLSSIATKLGCAAAVLTFAATTHATTLTLMATDNGWYMSDGSHSPTNTNTITGGYSGDPVSFYNFNTTALVGMNVTSASITFVANNGYYNSTDASETVQIWDVTTTPGLGGAVAVYNDLKSGVLYGTGTVFGSNGQAMPQFSVTLNSASYADISNGSFFSLGASSPTATSGQWIWSSSSIMPAAYLTVNYGPASVPEAASTMALLGFGLAGLAFAARRRKA